VGAALHLRLVKVLLLPFLLFNRAQEGLEMLLAAAGAQECTAMAV
jgi:hypothetical protein